MQDHAQHTIKKDLTYLAISQIDDDCIVIIGHGCK